MDEQISPGAGILGSSRSRIGTVDAVFADYLLVRTRGPMPVDLYVPRQAVTIEDGILRVDCGRNEAYARWHRPLKRAPHD